MINASELFSSKIAESTRQLSARLMYDTEEISGAIRSVQITSGACGEGNFTVGAVFSSYIEVVIDECEDILEDKELLLQIGLLIDDETVEHVDIGHYTVTKPKSSVYSTTFTAVGRITSKLNELFDVPSVLTLRNIADAITAKTGVAIIFNGEVSDTVLAKDITGLTCKEALSVIAGTFGGFATEDNSGNIVVSKYNTDSKVPVNGDRMTALPEFNDYDYELNGIKVIVSAAGEAEDGSAIEEVAFTEGTPRLTLTNEFMTADLFESFVANTVGYTYRPGTVPLALGDPRLQPWDCLEVTDVKDNIHIVPCLNIVHTFDGGLTTTITAPGESESESSSNVAGPIAQQMERMYSALITAQEAIFKRLKVDDLEAEVAKLGYATIDKLEAKFGELGYLKVDELESEVGKFGYLKAADLDVDYARIDQANITQAWVEDLLVTGDFLADEFTADVGNFTKYLTGVKIYGDIITAGTISTERLIIRDKNSDKGILYELNNIGDIIQSELSAEELKRLTLNGQIITAESITTTQLAAGAVKANNIDVIDLSAITANLGTVTAGVLQSENFTTSDFAVDNNGNITGSVLSGVKFDLNNEALYTPQITIKDNYIDINGYMTIGTRGEGKIGVYSLAQGYDNIAEGQYSHAEGHVTTASGWYSHAEGYGNIASGQASHAEGIATTASAYYSHAEGNETTASGRASHAEGNGTTASTYYSHAEGNETTASGSASHAEGKETTASGDYSHAEGNATIASGSASHAQGYGNIASGDYSHAEGYITRASGDYSHAEGYRTLASGSYQYVQGKYNIEDADGVYAQIIGNGSSDTSRSNAYTLDWDGNAWYAGNISEGGVLLSSKYAALDHTHDSFPLSGGTLTGPLTANDDITIANDVQFLGIAKDGAIRQILRYNGNNNLVLGYGNYVAGNGNTNIYGNDINLYCKGAIAITSPTAGLTDRQYGVNKVLWSGASLMTSDQTATLSEAISAQPHGIVLVWSYYNNNAGASQYWNCVFVPKWYAKTLSGKGMALMLTSTPTNENIIGVKYVYISDTGITGYAGNNNAGTTSSVSGATIKPNAFALRYVIGV